MEIEFIRCLLVFFAGAFLCLSGSLTQIISNNDLASPSTLGMDGLGVFTVLCGQLVLVYFKIETSLEIMSFILFIVVCFFILVCLRRRKSKKIKNIWNKTNIEKIVLLGLAFNLFIGAIFSIVQFLFIALNLEFPIGLWFGNFKFYEPQTLIIFVSVFIGTLLILLQMVFDLELITIGRDFALGVGVKVAKVQRKVIFLSLFLTGLVISFFGVFSFLGLILPHILRRFRFFRKNIRNEVLIGPFCSGALLSGLDFVCYQFPVYGAEVPVGMISGVLGAFFLIILLLKAKISSN